MIAVDCAGRKCPRAEPFDSIDFADALALDDVPRQFFLEPKRLLKPYLKRY